VVSNIAPPTVSTKERSEHPADGPLPALSPLHACLVHDNGTIEVERRAENYRNEHRTKVTGRFADGKRRARAMARYIQERAATCTDGIDKQRQLSKLANDIASCRNHLLFKDHYLEGKIRLKKMMSCKRALCCPLCAMARANKNVAAYHAKTLQLAKDYAKQGTTLRAWFVTLTVKNGVSLPETYDHFNRSVTRLVGRYGDAQKAMRGHTAFAYAMNSEMASVVAGVFSFEVKRGSRLGLWHPHGHSLLLSTGPINGRKLSKEWLGITGDSLVVKVIEIPTDDVKSLCEVLKYSCSFAELPLEDNFEIATALKHKKLLRSFGEFRGLKLDDDIDIDDTAIIDSPYIELLYRYSSGRYSLTTTEPRPELSTFAVDASGCIVPAVTLPPSPPYSPVRPPDPTDPIDSTPEHLALTMALDASAMSTTDPIPGQPPITHHEAFTMLRTGLFPLDANTFDVDGNRYLLCHRTDPTKGKQVYWLLALPSRTHVSALFSRSGGRYSLDFTDATGIERAFEVSFAEPGFIRLTDKGPTNRSLRPAPWQSRSRPGRR
jgi:hypothetical protein